ncbi:hypothetical protein B0O80DRAFT_38002 [Mortierella sp. GBAus27b]|nr:hypothetical protein B0O80DRAFT_38002 [Mortierella sp. GBAus27b]
MFDYVLLEITGLVDPASPFFPFATKNQHTALTPTPTAICDPESNLNETAKQIAMADRLILSKMDLVTTEELHHLEGDCRSQHCPRYKTTSQPATSDSFPFLTIKTFIPLLATPSQRHSRGAAFVCLPRGLHHGLVICLHHPLYIPSLHRSSLFPFLHLSPQPSTTTHILPRVSSPL